jgi:hypothetical protein
VLVCLKCLLLRTYWADCWVLAVSRLGSCLGSICEDDAATACSCAESGVDSVADFDRMADYGGGAEEGLLGWTELVGSRQPLFRGRPIFFFISNPIPITEHLSG